MKAIFQLSMVLMAFGLMTSCSHQAQHGDQVQYQCPMDCENGKVYDKEGSCSVCKMDLKPIKKEVDENAMETTETSIFNLTSKWKTQDAETIELAELKGDILVVVMIYTTCKAACPRLVADIRNIEAQVGTQSLKYVFVSIDPETDTPERMKEFAIENQMDGPNWVFLQGNMDDVREFSNVLAVKYRRISPLDFSHSNIITVFDRKGELQVQQEGLGVDNTKVVNRIKELQSIS